MVAFFYRDVECDGNHYSLIKLNNATYYTPIWYNMVKAKKYGRIFG